MGWGAGVKPKGSHGEGHLGCYLRKLDIIKALVQRAHPLIKLLWSLTWCHGLGMHLPAVS